jgi:methionine biosynthesis protein MetW
MSPDTIAEYYDRYHDADERGFDLKYVPAPKVAEILARAIPAGARCLDVGCAEGGTMAPLVARLGLSYSGTDISPAVVHQARERGLEARVMPAPGVLHFPDQSFDAVTFLEVIEHDFEPERTLAEVRRVLAPGGVLCVSTPNVAYWRRRLDLALLGRWNPFGYSLAVREPWGDPHIRFFTPASLARLLTKCGFVEVRVEGTGGGLLLDVPWLGQRLRNRGRHASPAYRVVEEHAPSLFGCFLMGTCRRPAGV